jgi:alkylation response protein AidB-like acyl-CoA dehydrogenase
MVAKTEKPDQENNSLLKTLPGDDVRQIMWRFSDRYDLQMVVQSSRSVARGIVAKLVAEGTRNTHEWTKEKAQLFAAFDESGVTSVFMDPKYGGYIEGPKNFALAIAAFELAWVDGGAATCSLATNLALAPIHEKGTQEQKDYYMSRCVPPQPGEEREVWRGAFALTEPLPYIGVDTGVVGGRIRIAEWEDGEEPILQVEKRGRFITNMAFANFVTAAVSSDDERIKGTCMIILEESDPGTFDPGAPTLKMVHQLSSTRDPIFNLKVPASRIIGGYTVKDGVVVPNHNLSSVIEAVFLRTRVAPGLMTTAKLLSSVEPVIRYQRQRFRGGDSGAPGTPRYDLGLQQKEDSLLRLVDVWACGEAGTSLGFATVRELDKFEPIENEKVKIFAEQGISGPRAQMKALKGAQKDALNCIKNPSSVEEIDTLSRYLILDSLVNVMCPACKLWNTGVGANMMREAVSLMGGYGITEDCPGFLPHKWMDAQLEATYEGPEAVQRRQLTITMTNELFLVRFEQWLDNLKDIAARQPGTGASTLAKAGELWLNSLNYLLKAKDANGKALYHSKRNGVTFPLADALSWFLASYFQLLDVIELEEKGPQNPLLAEGLPGFVTFFSDLCYVQAARTGGEIGRICSELVFGYNRRPEEENADYDGSDLDFTETFNSLRNQLDASLAGSRLARDRAGLALSQVMIPEALDYPA